MGSALACCQMALQFLKVTHPALRRRASIYLGIYARVFHDITLQVVRFCYTDTGISDFMHLIFFVRFFS